MADANVSGLKELQALLDQIPAKMEANVMRGALRAAAKPILEDARANAAKDSGVMAAGLKISTKKKGFTVIATIKAAGKHAHIAHWMEFGTRPHKIGGPLNIGGRWVGGVEHPGVKPRPFLRPALDANIQAALIAAGEYIKQRLATKHGLDTRDIQIGDDDES